jgi:hypothetical protein
MQQRNIGMPRHATARLEDLELQMSQPASREEMEKRRKVVARLRSRMDRPVTEAEKGFWNELVAELDRERFPS